MPLSKAFEDYIFRKTFSGLQRRENRIVVSRSLSEHLMNQLAETAINSFGYNSHKEARADINRIYTGICQSGIPHDKRERVDLRRLSPGTLINIEYEGGWILHMIYTSGGSLIVTDDMERSLMPGDELRPLLLSLECGKEAVFQVIRAGARYPSDRLYYHLNRIIAIHVSNNDGIFDLEGPQHNHFITGHTTAYVRVGDKEGQYFNQADLSESPKEALFIISFDTDGTISYSFNPNHAIDLTHLPEHLAGLQYNLLLEQISDMCDFSGDIPLTGLAHLTTLERGILRPATLPNGRKLLKVVKRAQLNVSQTS